MAISRKSRGSVIGVKVGLHDALFCGFPYKLRPKLPCQYLEEVRVVDQRAQASDILM